MPHRQTNILDEKAREEIIQHIKTNDKRYNYDNVNFNYFTDEELLFLKKRVDEENKNQADNKK